MTDTNADPPDGDQQQPPPESKGPPTWALAGLIFGLLASVLVFAVERITNRGEQVPAWGVAVGAVVLSASAYTFWSLVGNRLSSAVDRERDRLESAIETKARTANDDALAWIIRSTASTGDHEVATDVTGSAPQRLDVPRPSSYTKITVPSQAMRRANEDGIRFSTLLLDYYAHGLVQARRSSMASLWSSVLGIIVIIIGVGIAIFRTDTGIAASITVSLAGVVTNAVGVLFHQQANRALAHMETQTTSLRLDMRADQDGYDAVDLLGNVSDPLMRDRLLAAVVLQLTKATLPPAEEAARGGADNTQSEAAAATE